MLRKILSGLSWTFSERILAQGASLLIAIILARLLTPDEFGLITIILIFINVANIFVVNGFGEALIQKRDADAIDFSTIFWISFLFAVVLVVLIWILAPYIAIFYENANLTYPLRILSLKLILSSLNSIQQAYISKNLLFDLLFFSTLAGTVISAFIGITMAYMNCGVWALVFQYMINSFISTSILCFYINWRPQVCFSLTSAKTLIGFSWKITAAAVINEIYIQLRAIIIGKIYTVSDLAFYNKGNMFPQALMTNVNVAINKVFFPIMAKYNNDIPNLKVLLKRAIRSSTFIAFPIVIFLVISADNIVLLLLTDKWVESISYMRILCLFWIFQPMQTLNWQLLKAIGRSDICLKLEILKKTIGIFLVVGTMLISVKALAISAVVFAIISMLINMWPNRILINYGIYEQMMDIIPCFIICFLSTILTYPIFVIDLSNIIKCLAKAFIFFTSYIFLLYIYSKRKGMDIKSFLTKQ